MVDWRSTWCGIHWLGWVSFCTLWFGVAGMMTAIALPNFYSTNVPIQTNPNNANVKVVLGLWKMCFDVDVPLTSSNTVTEHACFDFDSGCNTFDGLIPVSNDCSQYHALTAVLMIAVILGALAIFVNWAALAIMLAHGSISTFVVKTGGFFLSAASGALGLLAMILAVNEKSHIFNGKVGVDYDASFAVLIVGWIFTVFSAVAFAVSARRCGGGFHSDGDKTLADEG